MSYSVYLSRCQVDGKLYVGLTGLHPPKRWRRHETHALNGRTTMHFHRAIKKHGTEAFEWVIWESGLTRDEACVMERAMIAGLLELGYELYNTTSGGETGGDWKHSEATKQKMRKPHRSFKKRYRQLSPEHRANIGSSQKGRQFSEEHRSKLSEAAHKRWETKS